MLKRFLILIVWLSLFPLFTVAQDNRCSAVPDKSAVIATSAHVITCVAQPGTLIVSWKFGHTPENTTFTVFNLGISDGSESSEYMEAFNFKTEYYSLRKSTLNITNVDSAIAGSYYCFVLDVISKETLYCESKLSVFVSLPFFNSTGINLAAGIVTNITCSVSFVGTGHLHMEISDGYSADKRSKTQDVFTSFGLHTSNLTYMQQVHLTQEGDYHTVSPDLGIQSAFACKVVLLDGYIFTLTVNSEVDAPVTRASIAPFSNSECSERQCQMHERLLCISDGKPKPEIFHWRLSHKYGNFNVLREQTFDQFTTYSGHNTFECRVFNVIDDYNFTAAGMFATVVEAFDFVIDKHATYESRGRKHEVWCPMTIVGPVAGIIWILVPCWR